MREGKRSVLFGASLREAMAKKGDERVCEAERLHQDFPVPVTYK